MSGERIGVIGAGTMGHGIAFVFLAAGHPVSMCDADGPSLEGARQQIDRLFGRAIEKQKATEVSRDAALARLTMTGTAAEASDGASLIIEAVPERLELKRSIFRELEAHAPSSALLASNTSSLSIGEIARPLRHRDRVLGMHFFNPVPVMKLLEIVRGPDTSTEAVDRARRFAEAIGKTAIVVGDTPGFATSRLGVVLGLEAIRMLEQGVASAEDIDRAMELGYNHPMGPLRLTDLVGLDVRLAIAEHLHTTLHDDTYRPPALLRRMVADGKLGRKCGQGFYTWENA